jgi:hypothetical protein
MNENSGGNGTGAQGQPALFGGLAPQEPGKKVVMAGAMETMSEPGEDVYGWCGLCESFTEFPHECIAENKPADEAA